MDKEQIYGSALLEALAQAVAAHMGTKMKASPYGLAYKGLVSGTPNASYGHGADSLFSFPGLEPDIISALILPELGLLDLLPSRVSNTESILMGIMTGVTATSGSHPTNVCDDPKTVGLMKLCEHTFYWGRFSLQTPVFDITRIGWVRNRSDFTDLRLVNDPFGGTKNPLVPSLPGAAGGTAAVRNEIAKALLEFGVGWAREFAQVLYTGNPANNTAGGGYKEPDGLDRLINTGYRDAETGVACPAADSFIYSFGNRNITTDAQAASDIVAVIDTLVYNLEFLAERTRLMPVKWVLVMTPALFQEVTKVWPCAYYTSGCVNTSASNNGQVDLRDMTELRDQMRLGRYLLVRGKEVPVVLDDTISETDSGAGVFTSSIYYVPLTVLGGRPVTYLEYFDADMPNGPMEMAKLFAAEGFYFTSNDGRYLWHRKPVNNWCVQLMAMTQWRVILETPQIAGRITNVSYTPLRHPRNWNPADLSYYADGGKTTRAGYDKSFYTPVP